MDPQAEDQDREDVRRVLDGDIDAFGGIVRRWQGPLVNLAYRFCRNRAVAEEMAQETFLRAFRKLALWRDDARFSSWLFSLALNAYRSQMRRHRLPEVPLIEDDQPAATASAHDEILRDEIHEVVRRAVARLPAKYRDTLILVHFKELGIAGAADALGIPEGTVKARLHRGRELLKKKLGGALGTPQSAETI